MIGGMLDMADDPTPTDRVEAQPSDCQLEFAKFRGYCLVQEGVQGLGVQSGNLHDRSS